jgi:DNA excision repair protein ERCC-5
VFGTKSYKDSIVLLKIGSIEIRNMGVKDLWQLLAPVGRRVSIETLDGKALAIDMSIWLTQFIKAMRDEEGKMIRNAHLIGTLRRILKLLFHKIRPIFVFDGATPILKHVVVQRRRKVHERQVIISHCRILMISFLSRNRIEELQYIA